MNDHLKWINFFSVIAVCFIGISCSQPKANQLSESQALSSELTTNDTIAEINVQSGISKKHHLGHGYEFDGNGKRYIYPKNDALFTLENDTVLQNFLTEFSSKELSLLNSTIDKNIARLKRQSFMAMVNGKQHNQQDLIKAQQLLRSYLKGDSSASDQLVLLRIRGEDSLSNVHFTGYYTPIIQVRKTKDKVFRHPIYRNPIKQIKGDTRAEIVKGEIYKGYEIGYTNDILLHYSMQVQGSGMAEYADGSQKLLRYAGSNGHAYRSLGKYFIEKGLISAQDISFQKIVEWFEDNPDSVASYLNYNNSYVFFEEVNDRVTGAAQIPLIPEYSIAVDDELFPYGAVYFSEQPIMSNAGLVSGYKNKILFSHDTGGAIKGAGHVDFYYGIGPEAFEKANVLHHYGYVWMLSVKKE